MNEQNETTSGPQPGQTETEVTIKTDAERAQEAKDAIEKRREELRKYLEENKNKIFCDREFHDTLYEVQKVGKTKIRARAFLVRNRAVPPQQPADEVLFEDFDRLFEVAPEGLQNPQSGGSKIVTR